MTPYKCEEKFARRVRSGEWLDMAGLTFSCRGSILSPRIILGAQGVMKRVAQIRPES